MKNQSMLERLNQALKDMKEAKAIANELKI